MFISVFVVESASIKIRQLPVQYVGNGRKSLGKSVGTVKNSPPMRFAVIESSLPSAHRTDWRVTCQLVAAVFAFSSGLSLLAENTSVGSITDREVQRRQSEVQEAQAQLSEASLLRQKGQNEAATRLLFKTYEALPESPLSGSLKSQLLVSLADASCAWAEELLAQGRKADALRVLDAVLAPSVSPGNAQVTKLRERANDPERHPLALTPEHIANAKKVERLLILAGSAADLGDYDEAIVNYQSAITLDRYNMAARRGMEKVEQLRASYFNAARDHKRSKVLSEVSSHWEDQVPPSTDVTALLSAGGEGGLAIKGKRERLQQKLITLRVPKLQFSAASLDEVIEFMRLTSRNMDPEGTGISFVVNVDPETRNRSISLDLIDVPIEELLRYVTQLTGTAYRVEENAVLVTSLTDKSTNLITKQYRVPPDFIQKGEVGAAAEPAADPFAAAPAAGAGGLLVRRMGAREFLESRGVTFAEGASASYSAGSSTLIVRNTADNLGLVDTLVEMSVGAAPKQVLIAVKMMEIGQQEFSELGADVGIGASNMPGADRVFMSGGSTGTAFKTEGSGSSAGPVGGLPLTTAGLRSSGAILGVPGLAELLGQGTSDQPGATSVSPSQFALRGVFTDPQFEIILRTLKQKKGVDVLTVPSIVAKSGQKASIHAVREFPYPTEFDPPQIPQNVGGSSTAVGTLVNGVLTNATSSSSSGAPIVPATPTNFEVKELGMVLEVEPNISADGRTVEISLTPNFTEFEGFIDYGSDIQNAIGTSTSSYSFGVTTTSSPPYYTQPNDILQPVFRKNSLNTAVTVYDGSTIALGGVIEERRADFDDKVPVLGDIPLIGRLWQSKMSQTTKKNVMFFITVTVVDPAGQRVNQVAASQATR
jgi:general secretion pathway protein D